MASKTTWKALDERAAAFVAALPANDPLKRANALIDRANAAVDAGDFTRADELFSLAEELIA